MEKIREDIPTDPEFSRRVREVVRLVEEIEADNRRLAARERQDTARLFRQVAALTLALLEAMEWLERDAVSAQIKDALHCMNEVKRAQKAVERRQHLLAMQWPRPD